MSSWQAYVDTSLVGTNNVDKAAIFNKEGTGVWASSSGFQVTPEETQNLVAHYADTEKEKKIFGTGFKIAGEKYLTLRADERSLYGRKGKEGICIVQTKQALLIAHYGESVQPGAAANTVEQLGDYLISLGY